MHTALSSPMYLRDADLDTVLAWPVVGWWLEVGIVLDEVLNHLCRYIETKHALIMPAMIRATLCRGCAATAG
jgi:hypothetical protein